METKQKIWIDCDTGQDDAIAIMYALYHPKIDLIGISTAYGNMSIDDTTSNTLRLLQMCKNNNVEVYQGSDKPLLREVEFADGMHGNEGLGGCKLPELESERKPISEQSFHRMYEKIKASKGLTYIAIGCLTNLSLLLRTYPDIEKYITKVSFMGGSQGIGNWQPQAEFNVYCDPDAAKIVFSSKLTIYQIPIETTHKYLLVRDEFLDKVAEWGTEYAQNVIGILNFYKQGYKKTFGFDFAILHDPVAVYAAIFHETHCKTEMVKVEVETKSLYCNGRTVIQRRVPEDAKNVHLVTEINDSSHFWNDLLENLSQINRLIYEN